MESTTAGINTRKVGSKKKGNIFYITSVFATGKTSSICHFYYHFTPSTTVKSRMVRLSSAIEIRYGLNDPFLLLGLEFGEHRQRQNLFRQTLRKGHIASGVAKIGKAGL
jgi:hypothetical protein